MEPIVSPGFIYLLGILDNVIGLFVAAAVTGGLVTCIYIIGTCINLGGGWEKEQEKWTAGWGRLRYLAVVLFLAGTFTAILTPSRNTLLGMYAASYITPDNLNIVKDAGLSIKNEIKADVIEILEAVGKEVNEAAEKSGGE